MGWSAILLAIWRTIIDILFFWHRVCVMLLPSVA
jgi:hypothetical protein